MCNNLEISRDNGCLKGQFTLRKSISAVLFHVIAANLFLLKASGKEKLKMAQPSFLISEEKNAKEKWEWKGTFQFDFYRTRVTSFSLSISLTDAMEAICYSGWRVTLQGSCGSGWSWGSSESGCYRCQVGLILGNFLLFDLIQKYFQMQILSFMIQNNLMIPPSIC